MANIIVAASPIYGHVAPLHIVAQALQQRGHDVTFLTGSRFPFVGQNGVEFVMLSGDADYDLAEVEARPERRALAGGPPQLMYDFRHIFCNVIPGQHSALQQILRKRGDADTILVHDTCFLGAWPWLLGATGASPAAVVGLGVTPLPSTSIDTAPFGLGLPPDASPAGRQRNQALNTQIRELFSPLQTLLDSLLAKLGATRPAPHVFDGMVNLPDRYLQLSIAELDYPRSDAPPGLRYVGALPAAPIVKDPPAWLATLGNKPVVAGTQGTVANGDLQQLIEPTLGALADLDVEVVALTGRDDAVLPQHPANARVESFVPFAQLMPYTDVLITNGGYGGVQQALTAGVPLVIAGETEDKIEVASRAEYAGVAINLRTSTPRPEQIRQAVLALLAQDGYRQRALELQRAYASHNALDRIEQEIIALSSH
jgi:UDP:flavonoid glycosyltransferase YjiC (YdhE family)